MKKSMSDTLTVSDPKNSLGSTSNILHRNYSLSCSISAPALFWADPPSVQFFLHWRELNTHWECHSEHWVTLDNLPIQTSVPDLNQQLPSYPGKSLGSCRDRMPYRGAGVYPASHSACRIWNGWPSKSITRHNKVYCMRPGFLSPDSIALSTHWASG